MRVYITTDEDYPIYTYLDNEQNTYDDWKKEIPDNLVERLKKAQKEWYEVQDLIRDYMDND